MYSFGILFTDTKPVSTRMPSRGMRLPAELEPATAVVANTDAVQLHKYTIWQWLTGVGGSSEQTEHDRDAPTKDSGEHILHSFQDEMDHGRLTDHLE